MLDQSKSYIRNEVYPLLIGGKEVLSTSGKTFATHSPADGKKIADVSQGNSNDIDLAVNAAKKAFIGPWSKMTPKERSRMLYKFAQKLSDKKDLLAHIEMLDVGKPIKQAIGAVSGLPVSLEFFASTLLNLSGETLNISNNDLIDFTLREPLGVCGLIVPWNYPVSLALLKIAPALAAGNTVVLKPSEVTPLSTTELGLAAMEAGLPEGVINIVHGFGDEVGSALALHPEVAKISFTGGTVTGRSVYTNAAQTLKRVTLELGGKSPLLVFADANIDDAVQTAYNDLTRNTGQVCAACTRLIIQDSIYEEFVEKLQNKIKGIRIGLPHLDDTEMGPVVSKTQLEKIMKYADIGSSEGARLAWGTNIDDRQDLKDGYFVAPGLFLEANNDMRVAREEIFGPIQTVIKFNSEDEAVRLANDTEYGLASAIYTSNASRAMRMSRQIKAGTVCINVGGKASVDAPFGGYKQSGIGKERGYAALLEDTQVKNVRFSTI